MQESTSQGSQNALPDSWIKRIFRELDGAFGSQFRAKFATDGSAGGDFGLENAMQVWSRGLAAYIAWPQSIRHGLSLAVQQAYPPSLGEFVALCRSAPRNERQALPDKTERPRDVGRMLSGALQGGARGGKTIEQRSEWAVKVLDRIKAGEKLPDLCRRNAEAALANLGINTAQNASAACQNSHSDVFLVN